MSEDPIAQLAESWRRELPDLDVGPMATVARLNRLSLLVNRRVEAALETHGRSLADFDVLSALRRQGAPFQLKPSELSRRVMLSPSGMTHRIDLLEAAGLVERHLDPSNRRSMPVTLTSEGRRVVEELVAVVVEVETHILRPLTTAERSSLDAAISAVIEELVS